MVWEKEKVSNCISFSSLFLKFLSWPLNDTKTHGMACMTRQRDGKRATASFARLPN